MDIFWIVLGGLFLAAGFIGCFLPLLPGPPLAYVGLLIQQLRSNAPFTTMELLIWLAVVVAVTILDYWVPVYGTKKFGGTQAGMWGATVGLFLGFVIGPWGIVIGPFIGAFVGEVMANQDSGKAFRAAVGSFVGFLLGTVIKLVTCGVMFWCFVMSWV